ncbi:MAG: hypothetical protein OEU92_08175, partial [Alphaproteobacteria bacterium]|nr:hypothetical protein [Alphaproteobacteria bacterium]
MLTLRLPIEDRRQGLAERPGAFNACAEASLSDAARPEGGDFAVALDRQAMAAQLEIACGYGAVVERVAARHGFLPSVIAGLCSRRSGWGLLFSPTGVEGTRDFQARAAAAEGRRAPLPPDGLGFARGLMGLDYDRHPLARETLWRDPERNIEAAFAVIAQHRATLRRCTTLQGTGLLRASLGAFECGLKPVEHAIRWGLDVDSPTIGRRQGGRGCGRDVLARADFFQAEGW